ncbi:MAG: hypothetical protein H6625_13225 [Bdellovibrionaceae bacterium]|nr:hypothetical protein [Pseudobdellovibrionaceae bacterium]
MVRLSYQTLNDVQRQSMVQVKTEVCKQIRKITMRRGWSQKQLAWYLGTSQACAGYVVCQRVEKLTCNQLFRYLVLLEPNFKFLISL